MEFMSGDPTCMRLTRTQRMVLLALRRTDVSSRKLPCKEGNQSHDRVRQPVPSLEPIQHLQTDNESPDRFDQPGSSLEAIQDLQTDNDSNDRLDQTVSSLEAIQDLQTDNESHDRLDQPVSSLEAIQSLQTDNDSNDRFDQTVSSLEAIQDLQTDIGIHQDHLGNVGDDEEEAYVLYRRREPRSQTIESDEDDVHNVLSADAGRGDRNLCGPSKSGVTGNVPAISIALSQKTADNKRKYDKCVACFFCEKLLKGKLKRHLEKMHSSEPEVAKLMALSSKQDSLKGFAELGHRGNFKHNSAVLSAREGSLIVRRRPSKKVHGSQDYLPCKHCLAMFLTHDLWRHTAKCPYRNSENVSASDDTTRRTSVTAASRNLLEGSVKSDFVTVSKEFREEILDRMHPDNVTRQARQDSLIMRFGSALHHRHGPQRVHNISQQMRHLARLLREVKKEDTAEEQITLERLLTGGRFDTVVEATERLCRRKTDKDTGRPMCLNPSYGLTLGHILVKCADMKKGMGIRTGDKVMENEADAFLSLHRSEWTGKISSASLTSLKHKRFNNPDILPLTADLLKLKNYQEKALNEFTHALKNQPNYSNWRRLSHIVYSRVVIFNKRRGGETAKMPLSAFVTRPKWQDVANDVLLQSLKPLEQTLLKRMDMLHLPGKGAGGRRVPLILTPNVVSAMELLTQTRDSCGIPKNNVHFFATSSSIGCISGWQVMDAVAKAAKVTHPKLIRSTRLRKYVATVSQIVSLTSGEMKWLANHLGHDVNILQNVYRLQDSTIELAKISRLMMAVDTGQIAQFAGKALDDINIADISPNVDDNTGDEECSDDENHTPSDRTNEEALCDADYVCAPSDRAEDAGPSQLKRRKAGVSSSATLSSLAEETAQPQTKRKRIDHGDDDDDDCTMSDLDEENAPSQLKCRKPGIRVKWSEEEISILQRELASFFKSSKRPTTAEIKRVKEKHQNFARRTVPQMLSRAWALIQRQQQQRGSY